MSEPDWVLEADPKRPYKMYAAIAAAMLTTLLTYADVLPVWVLIVVNMILSGLFVYSTGNPLRVKQSRHKSPGDDPALF